MATSFTYGLADYLTESGIIIPNVSDVQERIENAFREIFSGQDLDTTTETPIGRLIEALTLMVVNVVGINAQNANQYNLNYATGAYLEALASLFMLEGRKNGESDSDFRNRIKKGRFHKTAFVDSIYSEVMAVDGVKAAVVLDNGTGVTKVTNGISIPAHSIFVCVEIASTDDDGIDLSESQIETIETNVAKAIYRTRSAGCGFTTSADSGTKKDVQVTDSYTGHQYTMTFFEPTDFDYDVSVKIRDNGYTGTDITEDVENAIRSYFDELPMGGDLSPTELAIYISRKIPTISVTESKIGGSTDVISIAATTNAVAGDIEITRV